MPSIEQRKDINNNDIGPRHEQPRAFIKDITYSNRYGNCTFPHHYTFVEKRTKKQ